MKPDLGEACWADEVFGETRLGDPRRTGRLVEMAAAAARNPAGQVTQVFETSAAREGAFRLLENDAVRSAAVATSVFAATARNCVGQRVVFVAIDATTLTLVDRKKIRDLGRVGPRYPSRGLHVMSALAVNDEGGTIGLLEQRWWARTQKKRAKKLKCFDKSYLKTEARYWHEAISLSEEGLRKHAPQVRAWYQLDRGADSWPLLELALAQKLLVTVRSCHERRLLNEDGSKGYLRPTVRKQRILGHYSLNIPARPNRPARIARIAVRACPVVIHAHVHNGKRRGFAVNAVCAEEVDYRGKDRIRWILLTTAPTHTFQQARAVVAGYSMRWRIEDFHRAWKRGLCKVEDSLLQSRGAIVKWATILAAVAARALRLAKLIRTTPEIPASEEFTEYEIDAAFILVKKKRDRRRNYSVADVIGVIADIGGFANKYSRLYPFPGPTILGRGLERVRILAMGLKNMAEMR
jgi:hypothetical protein